MSTISPLPIDSHLSEIVKMVSQNMHTLIKASAGSGKTTRIPPKLLDITQDKILILEPRRLAAKMQALRISLEMSKQVGEVVGYLFKGERALSEATRLLFITEGTLLRFLETDPLLHQYSIIVLDEFHERHIETDLAFYHLQIINQKRILQKIAPIKIVYMSATLDTSLLKNKLGALAEFNIEIPPFERKTYYLPNIPSILNAPLTIKVKNAIAISSKEQSVGTLIFAPGKKEIQDILEALENDSNIASQYELAVLHGELSKNEQQNALLPPFHLNKKIVIATNIAESSITIPYVNVVIDTGLEREYAGNVVTGFGKLITKKIARASAEQRAGRSNRTGPGVVYRLYSQQDFEQRDAHKMAAIHRAPMMEPLISIIKNHGNLDTNLFLECPSQFQLDMGLKQLAFLNLIDPQMKLTTKGNFLNQKLEIRLALIELAYQQSHGINIKDLIYLLHEYLDIETKNDFEQALKNAKKNADPKKLITDVDELILNGFLDLVGLISSDRKIILQNGQCFILHPSIENKLGKLMPGSLAVIISMNANEEVNSIIPLEIQSVLAFKDFLTSDISSSIIPNGKKKITTKTKLGILTLLETHRYEECGENDNNEKLEEILNNLVSVFFQSEDYIRYQFYRYFFGNPNESKYDANLLIEIYKLEWSSIGTIESFHHQEFLRELKSEYLAHINSEYSMDFESLFPKNMRFTDRRETPLMYEIHGNEYMVFVESYMQDFYGLNEGPKIANGMLSLTFRLLGPHKRALQITKDLNSFWSKTYKEMQKELVREYPRHHWPDNPTNAKPVLLKRMIV